MKACKEECSRLDTVREDEGHLEVRSRNKQQVRYMFNSKTAYFTMLSGLLVFYGLPMFVACPSHCTLPSLCFNFYLIPCCYLGQTSQKKPSLYVIVADLLSQV